LGDGVVEKFFDEGPWLDVLLCTAVADAVNESHQATVEVEEGRLVLSLEDRMSYTLSDLP
jgi:hypothetical protein